MYENKAYTDGGTVQPDTNLYITRKADEELLALCRAGFFAYVLSPRQMGKSSLMVRTTRGLNAQNIRSVIIDLSQLGVQSTTDEEWYLGLLTTIEDQLDLQQDVYHWWQASAHLGLAQRLTLFFQEVLLPEIKVPVVVFVDEIDATLSLPFTDDFYAAIRHLYNARASVPVFQRLSFVLIGVATPGDLIRDPQRTPFNIGKRVELSDWTFEEALPLANGLGLEPERARQVLRWLLKWTGGHPYLTQHLCLLVAEKHRSEWSEPDVDALVEDTFFKGESLNNNIAFVRDMLTKRADDPTATLTLYRKIRRSRAPIYDEEQSQVKSHLKLSGVVRRNNSTLHVRNLIYKQVFNDRWVKEHLPFNWTEQFQRLRRAAIAAAVIFVLFILTPLAIYALHQRNQAVARAAQLEHALQETQAARDEAKAAQREAEQLRQRAEEQRQIAETQRAAADGQRTLAEEATKKELTARRQAEDSAKLAQEAEQEAQKLRAEAVKQSKVYAQQRDIAQGQHQISVAHQLVYQGEQQLRAGDALSADVFLARALTLDDRPAVRSSLLEAEAKIAPLVWEQSIKSSSSADLIFKISPDGRNLALADDGAIKLIDTDTGNVIRTLPQGIVPVKLIYSLDGKQLASQNPGKAINIWNVETGKLLRTLNYSVSAELIHFNSNTKQLIQLIKTAGQSGFVISDSETGKDKHITFEKPVVGYAFSSDGKTLAVGEDEGHIKILNTETGEARYSLSHSYTQVVNLAFGMNGKILAAKGDYSIKFWDMGTGKEIQFPGFNSGISTNLVFSPDGRMFATSDRGGVRIWDAEAGKEKRAIPFSGDLTATVIDQEETMLAACGIDGTTRIWDVETGEVSGVLYSKGKLIAFSPNGRRLYLAEHHKVRAWDATSGHAGKLLAGHTDKVTSIAFSPDGKLLASTNGGTTFKWWNVDTGKEVGSFAGGAVWGIANFDPQRGRIGTYTSRRNDFAKPDYRLWNTKTGKEITIPHEESTGFNFPNVSGDGRILAMQDAPGTPVRIRDLETGKDFILSPINETNNAGNRETTVSRKENIFNFTPQTKNGFNRERVSLSHDGRLLAQAGSGGTIKIWNIETEREVALLLGRNLAPQLVFTLDNRRLASVSEDYIEIWDIPTERVISNISKLSGDIGPSDFSPDGRMFAAIVDSRWIKLWDSGMARKVR